MSTITPARIGFLVDTFRDPEHPYSEDMLADLPDGRRRLRRPRPPRAAGRVRRARRAGPAQRARSAPCATPSTSSSRRTALVIFGPYVSENGVAAARARRANSREVAVHHDGAAPRACSASGCSRSTTARCRRSRCIMAAVGELDGCHTVGIAYENSLIGDEYLRSTRVACREYGLRITAEVAIPQVETEKRAAMEVLADRQARRHHARRLRPRPLRHERGARASSAGCRRGTRRPRSSSRATSRRWRQQLAGWIGLDSFDERNPVGAGVPRPVRGALTAAGPSTSCRVYCYDMARVIVHARSPAPGRSPDRASRTRWSASRCSPRPAARPGPACGSAGYIRQGWVGSEYLVARRVLDDGSRTVLHGTIEGLVDATGAPS